MRQVFLDTETTGLNPVEGHRIIEVVALAYESRRPVADDDGCFHAYCNPERDITADAENVHGMSVDFLADKPRFAEIAVPLQEFLRDSELIIHNADFDCDFLDAEFKRLDMPPVRAITQNVLCTLNLSRRQNTSLRRHRLEDLCKYFGVDDSTRVKHNALLDARLLAEVYLRMTRGQIAMEMVLPMPASATVMQTLAAPVRVLAATEEEVAAHAAYLQTMEKETGMRPLWWRADD